MAGFYLRYTADFAPRPQEIRLVDLGSCEVQSGFEGGGVRAAWIYWKGSKQWRVVRDPRRLLIIDGQPDRYPDAPEPVSGWMRGRGGVFRGFEVQFGDSGPARVSVFVDPIAVRPVFCLEDAGGVSFADKIATLAVNSDAPLEPDWASLLEAGVLVSLYSRTTTIKGVQQLAPGTLIEVEAGRIVSRRRYRLPVAVADLARERREPVAALRDAMTTAINDTWTDPDARLLLSGGMDSRSTLIMARGPRKTLTLNLYPHETKIAEDVAKACGADHEVFDVPLSNYQYALDSGYLLTGGMHWVRSAHPAGLSRLVRRLGVPGICHGWPYNNLFRNWAARLYDPSPVKSSSLYDWIGRKAYYLENFTSNYPGTFDRFKGLLSADGQHALRTQLRALADELDIIVVNGVDVSFERRLVSELSRQVAAAWYKSWIEGVDAYSPAFHPAIWAWYGASNPRDRMYDRVYREMLLSSGHPAMEVPDSNTGRKLEHLAAPWQDKVRDRFWYPMARAVYLNLFRKPPESTEFFPSGLCQETLEHGIAEAQSSGLVDREMLQRAHREYVAGHSQWMDVLWAFATLGQWAELLRQGRRFTNPAVVNASETERAVETA